MNYKAGDSITKDEALTFALHLAEKGLGHVEPNPCVGCVVIDEDRQKLVSFGYHEKFGSAHAEVNALKSLESGEGLTIIVSLEPCSHFGKTPPCADLVISKAFKKLVYIDKDPNPKVSGQGLKKIEEAGIVVEQADQRFSKINRQINSKFFYAFEQKKTFFHLKWAQSKDGYTNPKDGSQWITNEKSREYGQFLRAQSDAVLIGRGTLETDDPSLNIRLEGFEKENKVIVFDPKLKTLSSIQEKKVFKIRPAKSIIYLCEEPQESDVVDFVALHRKSSGEYCLQELAKDLYRLHKLQSVFVEGGVKNLSHFLSQREYQRASVFTSSFDLGDQGELPIESGPFDHMLEISKKKLENDTFFDYLVK